MSGALGSFATGLLALCGILVVWVTVQHAWQRVFPAHGGDPDALTGRLGCRGSCRRTHSCTRRCEAGGAGEEVET